MKNFAQAITIAERLRAKFKLPFQIGTQEAIATVSIGIAFSNTGYKRAEDLLQDDVPCQNSQWSAVSSFPSRVEATKSQFNEPMDRQ